jgi:hypothetical protein
MKASFPKRPRYPRTSDAAKDASGHEWLSTYSPRCKRCWQLRGTADARCHGRPAPIVIDNGQPASGGPP